MEEMSIEEQNQFKRMELALLYGFPNIGEFNTIEEETTFLDAFLEIVKKSHVTIYEKIGKPEFKTEEMLSDEEIIMELERFYQLLADNELELKFYLNDHLPRDIYRGITAKIFRQNVPYLFATGEIGSIYYEDYVFNREIEVKIESLSFWESYLNKNEPFDYYEIVDAKNKKAFDVFRDSYDRFEINCCEILDVKCFDDLRFYEVLLKIEFDGIIEDIAQIETYSGTSIIVHEYFEDGWEIVRVDLPKRVKL